MMRPTLFQLIEYVRDGETDPLVKEALGMDKRGDRRLRQARFICKMIGRQPIRKSKPEPDAISETFMAEWISESPREFRAFEDRLIISHRLIDQFEVVSEEASYELFGDEVPEVARLLKGPGVPGQDLGSLTISRKDKFIELSLESEHEFTETASGELRIDLSDYSISMSTRFPAMSTLAKA